MNTNEIKVHDKTFVKFLDASLIENAVQEIAHRINEDYRDKSIILLVILNGSYIFAADLSRKIIVDCDLQFVKLSSYQGTTSTGEIKEIIGLHVDMKDKHVVVVEDIVDTGRTIDRLLSMLKNARVASVEIASAFIKPDCYHGNYPIKYAGISIPEKFVIGYGLDYDGKGRHLKDIYQLKV